MPDMPNSALPGAEGPPSEAAKMIVFGVSFSTTKEGFREYWAQYGELAECELMFGRDGRYVCCTKVLTTLPRRRWACWTTSRAPARRTHERGSLRENGAAFMTVRSAYCGIPRVRRALRLTESSMDFSTGPVVSVSCCTATTH